MRVRGVVRYVGATGAMVGPRGLLVGWIPASGGGGVALPIRTTRATRINVTITAISIVVPTPTATLLLNLCVVLLKLLLVTLLLRWAR